MGLFSKNDHQDLTRQEQPRPPRGVPGQLSPTFDADANGLYRMAAD